MAEDVCKTLKQIFRDNGIDEPDQALINLRVSISLWSRNHCQLYKHGVVIS
jgi:hypothetical protein